MDLVSLLYAAAGLVLGIGGVWVYVSRGMIAVKEVSELLSAIAEALEDKKITPAEIANIAEEYEDVKLAIKEIFKKTS